ncbi:MAG: hypothetical protein KQH59_18330 [Desulfobulbaceae bacterium]|nr:hypothetical protein [Desulfobulbaceae bacterium]
MELTDKQLHTLRHMLGINKPYDREPRPYRNYAAVNPGDQEFAELERIGAVELVRKAGSSGVCGGLDCFRCSTAGIVAAALSHRQIRKPKRKRLYHCYLGLSDLDADLTFKEFLTSPDFADVRAKA